MADKFINETGLRTIRDWANGKFAKETEFQALSDTVDDLVTEGGEPNKIDTVKVNGTALVPDAQKAVDVTVPTKVSELTNDGDGTSGSAFATEDYVDTYGGKIDKIKVNGTEQTITNKEVDITMPTKVSDLTNDGDGTAGSEFATKSYVDTNGGKIDKIKVNGTEQTITNKEVDITMPTKVSDLTNDSDFQTETEVQALIDAAVTSAYIYKGSVATYEDLPSTDVEVGHVYNVESNGMNYAWNGTAWDPLGQLIDTSTLWTKSELTAMTVAEVNAILEPTT